MARGYVVVKGHFGMGGRIAVMLTALQFSRNTGRELIVDWNDPIYYSPTIDNVFANLFLEPKVNQTSLVELRGLSVYPELWKGRLEDFRNDVSAGSIPLDLLFCRIPDEDVPEDVVVVTRNTKQDFYEPLYFELELHPEVGARVESYKKKYDFGSMVGVQIRHGNGELDLIPPDLNWFYREIDRLGKVNPYRTIFLCTDSPQVVNEFEKHYPNLVVTEKWYPRPGSGAMHLHPDCGDRFQMAVEALTDIWLLKECSALVSCKGFFGIAARVLSKLPSHCKVIYPGRIHPLSWKKSDKAKK